jgi:hypothetical protein
MFIIYNIMAADIIDYNEDLEHLLKLHAEECESFSILHRFSYEKYSERSNYINIPVIILSSAIGFATGIDIGYDKMNIILGVSSIFVGIIKSIDTYFQLGKRSEAHRLCSLQFQQINKKIMIELSLKREQRISAKDMLQIIKTDIKNLQDIAPLIDEEIIKMFKKNYGEEDPVTKKIKFNAHTPNLCNGLTQVTINGDKPSKHDEGSGRNRRRRRSYERRSRGSSRGSGSYDSDNDSSGGDSNDGRGGRGSRSSRGSRGGRGGSGRDNNERNGRTNGNISSASASSGFMSSVSNFIQKSVNYIKGNTPPPTPPGHVSDNHRSDRKHSSRHHSPRTGNKNESLSSPHGDKHNTVIEIMGADIPENTFGIVSANKEVGELINIPISAINSAPNSGTNSVKNTPYIGGINHQLSNNLPVDFTTINVSDIQESANQLQQLKQLQELQELQNNYQSQNSHRSNRSYHSHQSSQSHRPAVPEAVAVTLISTSRAVSRPPSSSNTPLRTTPSILNQPAVQNINTDIEGRGLTLTADVVYSNNNNENNNNVSIIQEEVTNNVVTVEPRPNIIPQNVNNTDNIVIDVLPITEQPPIDNNAESVAVNLNLPVLHYNINDDEGMM